MKRTLAIILTLSLAIVACEEFINTVEDGLSKDEIIEGLKTALNVGTDSASGGLSVQNGYYGNALVKIPLPQEAIKVQEQINKILAVAPSLSSYLNLDTHFENVVKSMNYAAEDAAKEAAPIFKNAITGLSISDGLSILQGQVPEDNDVALKSAEFDSTAATGFLKLQTYTELSNLYAPKINTSLDKNIGNLGFSANQAWNTLRTTYNNAISTINGNFLTRSALQITGYSLNELQTESIGVFATEKALDGLFLKVGHEEIKIRRDPWAWASSTVGKILETVFGKPQEEQ